MGWKLEALTDPTRKYIIFNALLVAPWRAFVVPLRAGHPLPVQSFMERLLGIVSEVVP